MFSPGRCYNGLSAPIHSPSSALLLTTCTDLSDRDYRYGRGPPRWTVRRARIDQPWRPCGAPGASTSRPAEPLSRPDCSHETIGVGFYGGPDSIFRTGGVVGVVAFPTTGSVRRLIAWGGGCRRRRRWGTGVGLWRTGAWRVGVGRQAETGITSDPLPQSTPSAATPPSLPNTLLPPAAPSTHHRHHRHHSHRH